MLNDDNLSAGWCLSLFLSRAPPVANLLLPYSGPICRPVDTPVPPPGKEVASVKHQAGPRRMIQEGTIRCLSLRPVAVQLDNPMISCLQLPRRNQRGVKALHRDEAPSAFGMPFFPFMPKYSVPHTTKNMPNMPRQMSGSNVIPM